MVKNMQKIYFTRHGETEWNVKRKICGKVDVSLTALGREQAYELGQKVLTGKLKIDCLLCSPLLRAVETAKIISNTTDIPFKIDNRLREEDFGTFEGTTIDQKEFYLAKKNFVYSFETGESVLKVTQRLYNLLDELRTDHNDKNFLLISHNGLARVMHSYFHDMTNDEFDSYHINNCEIMEYTFYG